MKPIENLAPFELTAVDKKTLSTREEDFKPHTWDEAKRLIAENKLDQFKRRPTDLVAYISWSSNTTHQHGSLSAYVLKKRLRWPHDESGKPTFQPDSPTPFSSPSDYRILRNDWPYAFVPGEEIVHLIIWLKTPIETDGEGGDVTDASRQLIADFVKKTFTDPLVEQLGEEQGTDRVIWFKNWKKLQSVGALEHVHVLVRGVPDAVIKEWTRRKDGAGADGGDHAGNSPVE